MAKKKVTPKGRALARRVYNSRLNEYQNKKGVIFKKGDSVGLEARALVLYKKNEGETLVGNPIVKTRIANLLPDVKGMVVLEQRIGGYWTWHVNDLVKV